MLVTLQATLGGSTPCTKISPSILRPLPDIGANWHRHIPIGTSFGSLDPQRVSCLLPQAKIKDSTPHGCDTSSHQHRWISQA